MSRYDQKSKRKFRDSKRWKEFRKRLKEERKVCEVTGSKLTKRFQVHHCDMNEGNYENLDPENFVCLSWNMHRVIHMVFLPSRPREWRRRVLALIRIWKKMEKLLESRNK